eukprot:871974-Amorphochlora_amoeboformis.AAC.2
MIHHAKWRVHAVAHDEVPVGGCMGACRGKGVARYPAGGGVVVRKGHWLVSSGCSGCMAGRVLEGANWFVVIHGKRSRRIELGEIRFSSVEHEKLYVFCLGTGIVSSDFSWSDLGEITREKQERGTLHPATVYILQENPWRLPVPTQSRVPRRGKEIPR